MSANMYAALMEEPVAPAKPSAASAAPTAKPANKPVVGGVKKSDVSNRSPSPANSLPVSQGKLPGEIRKDTNKGPRKQHQPRTEQGGRIRGREFDRHSGTGRPATENKRGGAGRNNWGSVKDGRVAQRDEEAAAEVAAAVVEGEVSAEIATSTEVAADAGADSPKQDAPQEPKLLPLSAWKAEKAKKQKELEALVGGPAPAPAREIKPDWYKPEEKQTTTSSSSSKASSSAAKEQKQVKKVIPLAQILGEKHQPRDDRPRGPRRDREGSGEFRREGNRTGGNRQQGGQRKGGKQRPTFDATAVADLPAL